MLALLGLLLLAAGLRLWALDRDPPPADLLPDAAPWTDEGTIGLPAVLAARGSIPLTAALVDGTRPVHRLLLYAAFKLIGPGQAQGRMLSALLGLVGLAALAALSRALWPGPGPLLALLLGATSFFFTVYDRLLLTEGPLVALLALLALAGVRARSRPAALAVGVGVAVLGAGFKLHGLGLFPALAAVYALRRPRLLLPLAAGTAVTLLVWRLVFIPSAAPIYTAYLGDRIQGERFGLVPLKQALEQIATPGLPALFFQYQMPLLLLASVEVLAFLVSPRSWLRTARSETVLALVWLGVAVLGASVFRYIAARYFHTVSPALLLVAIAGARRFWQAIPFVRTSVVVQSGLAAGATAFIFYQTLYAQQRLGQAGLWIVVSGFLLLLALFVVLAGGSRWNAIMRGPVLAAVVLCQLYTQGSLFTRGVIASLPHLAEVRSELTATLPPDALIVGRLAGTIALSTPVRGIPVLDNLSLGTMHDLASKNELWVLVLQRDEWLIDPKAWPFLVQEGTYPVEYTRWQRSLQVYRFRTSTALR